MYKTPYKSVTSQTISRWIKNIFKASGIDCSIFSGHSTRHSSTSAALRAGINIETIRKTAGWTSSSQTFANFYNLPIVDKSAFARAIINNR